jgi:acetyl esterase/lipase
MKTPLFTLTCIRRTLALGLAACAATAAWGQPQPPSAYPADLQPTWAEVAYAPTSPRQRLDLFVPDGAGPFPLVINIHGGGFRMGSKEMLDAPLAKALLAQGVAVASVNYRLSDEATFPAAVHDVTAAVRFLRANANQYRLNPLRFVAFGQSAGGNLASMLGTTGHTQQFQDPALGHGGVSAAVQGVIDWFGPADFLSLDDHATAQGCPADHHLPDSPESRYLGSPLPQAAERARQASPLHHITPQAPPFLLQKGDQDCLIPLAQSVNFHRALRAAGVAAELDILPGGGHGDRPGGPTRFLAPSNIERVVTFVRHIP